MKQPSIKAEILNFIRVAHMGGVGLVAGGAIESYLREIKGTKGHTTTRRLQEMAHDGLIEPEYSRGYVRYRIPQRTYEVKVVKQPSLI